MYSLNKGTKVIPITMNNDVVAGQDSLYATAALDEVTNELIIKLVNADDKEQSHSINLEGVKKPAKEGKLIVLKSANTFENPVNISPQESTIAIKGKNINLVSAPYSFTILRIKML
jgi:alpha-L-arabinofuranosidase